MSAVELQAQSQSISLLPLNGTQFTSGKKVIFELTPDLGFMRASRGESYLSFTVRNSGTARWMFATSGQSLIQRVDIFSMATGQQLESLQEYNKMMWLIDQYGQAAHGIQQSSEGMRRHVTSLKTLASGATTPRLVSSDGTPESVMNSIISPITTAGVMVKQGWQVLVPLKAGLFSCFQEEKLTPIMALGGLRIELTLEVEALVCVPIQPIIISQELRIVRPSATSFFTINAVNSATFTVTGGAAAGLVAGQTVFCDAQGVGANLRQIVSVTPVGANATVVLSAAFDATAGANPRLVVGMPLTNAGELNTVDVAQTSVEQCGLAVGQAITLSSNGVAAVTRNITAIAVQGNGVRITFDGDAIDFSAAADANAANVHVTEAQWEAARSYAVDALEYRVQQIMPPKSIVDKVDRGIAYSFRSWDLFFDSIPSGSRRHQVEIPSVSSMAKSIWSHFSFASEDQDPNMPQYYTGATPDDMALNSLQYFINNKLFPLRDYDPRVKRDRPQQYNELQKAFSAMGTGAASFGDASGSNLDGYSNTFLACRELARGRYVYSLREAEPSIRLSFASTRSEITRVNTFVWSDKVVRVGGDGISVIL